MIRARDKQYVVHSRRSFREHRLINHTSAVHLQDRPKSVYMGSIAQIQGAQSEVHCNTPMHTAVTAVQQFDVCNGVQQTCLLIVAKDPTRSHNGCASVSYV